MNERPATRLYITDALANSVTVELSTGQAHQLRSVLRLGPGAPVAAFNATDGEWLCRIAEIGRGGARLTIEHKVRSPAPEPDLWLLFAPIKRARLDWLVEKATELGVSMLMPVWTAR
ncbi:MAG: 16S rRNA (uracil(1498)-N(3))-methyltransferase, partial [Alphaproteobacteria bacterium]